MAIPPIMAIPKRTNGNTQLLSVGGETISIPPNTIAQPSLLAVHTHPTHWEEPLVWKSPRWISGLTSAGQSALAAKQVLVSDTLGNPRETKTETGPGTEELFIPPQGTYFSWSDGPQNCLGLKFSQVEYVAVLSSIFRRHRISIVLEQGESDEQGRKRALETTADCDVQMLLRMRNADRVKLRCSSLSDS